MTDPSFVYVTGRQVDGFILNMPYDLGDGLSRTLVDQAAEGDDPSIWWLYLYQGRAPDGRVFVARCPMTPEFVDDQGDERVRAFVIEEWRAALDRALAEDSA